MTQTTGTPDTANDLAGKYLTFRVGDEEYGLEILKVREIIGLMDITKVPRSPAYIRGVINLRGRIIPVMDLRRKFEMETIEDTDETCIIVVDAELLGERALMGILVDRVSEVLDIQAEQIEHAPALFGGGVDSSYIRGMAKLENDVAILLSTERILSVSELSALGETMDNVTAQA